MLRETADDRQTIAKRLERRQDRRQLEVRALTDRRPVVDAGEVPRDAVRHVDEAQATKRAGRRLRERDAGRDHRVEQRQRERRAHAAQDRPRDRELSW